MDSFEYLVARDVKEACTLLARYREEAKILAGGQALVNLMKEKLLSPSYVVDIKGMSELDYIRYDEKEGLRIGALATHRSIEKSKTVKDKFPMLAEMERSLASVAVRNWGTVGGNLCHADPASDLSPSLVALGAEAKLTGPKGMRVVKLEDFFVDYFETVLKPDEILTEIRIPNAIHGAGTYMKFALRAADLPIAGVATHLIFETDRQEICRDVRIVMGSVGPTPLRSRKAEDLLKGRKIGDKEIEEAAQLSSKEARPTTDINGSEEYKREIVEVLVKRTIKASVEKARLL